MKMGDIWSVGQLTRYVKSMMERDDQLSDVWIRGEISNFTHHSSGHMYFTLKDAESKIKVVMFASYNRFLKFLPKNGTKAIVRGSISVFERDGSYQLYAREMQPDGLGSLYLAFEQLKEKLQLEGLFAAERKRALPRFPKTVGVITSPTGAAIRDIVTTIRRRFPQASITIAPAIVQGKEAPASLVEAIRLMNLQMDIDVLIVGRGGGSIEELWAFNDEQVARAIVSSRIPVISAVGHETDFTIADFVADVRAATPTAAAELAVPHYLEWVERIRQLEQRLHRAVYNRLQTERKRLVQLQNAYGMRTPLRRVEEARQQLDDNHDRLQFAVNRLLVQRREQAGQLQLRLLNYRPDQRIKQERERVERQLGQLQQTMQRQVERARSQWLYMVAHLDALSPLKVMQRGYTLVYKENQLIKSVDQFAEGDKLMVRFKDGAVHANVVEIDREEKIDERKAD